MADDDADIPDTGAVFTFGKSKFNENLPGKFWIRNDRVLSISAGDEHSALVGQSGRLFTFGSNNSGQLGLPKLDKAEKPTCVKALKQECVRLAACGYNHTIVSTESGNLYGFGSNNESQLGRHTNEADLERKPVQIDGFPDNVNNFKELSVGFYHCAALTDDSRLFLWGSGKEGQLGETIENIVKPKLFCLPSERRTHIASVSCGSYFTIVLTSSGNLYSFGENDSYQLGLGDNRERSHPTKIDFDDDIKVISISCGGEHALALTKTNSGFITVYSWGDDRYGQLGHGTRKKEVCTKPTKIDVGRRKIEQIYAGHTHSALITDHGCLLTFGDGRHGKLGQGQDRFVNEFKPIIVERFRKLFVESVSCGGCHSIVLANRSEVSGEEEDIDEEKVDVRGSSDSIKNHIRDSIDLTGSLSARRRRQENILSSSMNARANLPTLNSLRFSNSDSKNNRNNNIIEEKECQEVIRKHSSNPSSSEDDDKLNRKKKKSTNSHSNSAPIPHPRPRNRETNTIKQPKPVARKLSPIRDRKKLDTEESEEDDNVDEEEDEDISDDEKTKYKKKNRQDLRKHHNSNKPIAISRNEKSYKKKDESDDSGQESEPVRKVKEKKNKKISYDEEITSSDQNGKKRMEINNENSTDRTDDKKDKAQEETKTQELPAVETKKKSKLCSIL